MQHVGSKKVSADLYFGNFKKKCAQWIVQGKMRARTHGVYAWICSLSFCKIIKTKRISNPTAWFIILYCPIRDQAQYLVLEEKKCSAAYFQLSCAQVPNEIFNRNLSFLNLIFTTCAETSFMVQCLLIYKPLFFLILHCKLMRCIQFWSHISWQHSPANEHPILK